MPTSYVQRIATRQFVDTTDITGLFQSVIDTAQSNALGTRIFVWDPSGNPCGFVYAKIQSPTALAQGVPMYWVDAQHTTVTDTVAQALTYKSSTDGAVYSGAGICVSTGTTNGQYAWIQTTGYFTAVANSIIATPANPGDIMVLSNAAGSAPSNDVYTRLGVGTAAATPEAIQTLFLVCVATGSPNSAVMIMGNCAVI